MFGPTVLALRLVGDHRKSPELTFILMQPYFLTAWTAPTTGSHQRPAGVSTTSGKSSTTSQSSAKRQMAGGWHGGDGAATCGHTGLARSLIRSQQPKSLRLGQGGGTSAQVGLLARTGDDEGLGCSARVLEPTQLGLARSGDDAGAQLARRRAPRRFGPKGGPKRCYT